jgi:hypothetical protein
MLPVLCCAGLQTVANEFYDPAGRFSQQAWAGQLQAVLQKHGGTLHSKAEAYSALRELVASLGDRCGWGAGL